MFLTDVRKTSLGNTIGNILRIHEGEFGQMAMLWLALFFTITANFLLWSVIQVTFIKRVGIDFLPYLYLSSSVAILVGSALYARFSAAYRKTTVMHVFNVVTIICVTGSWYLLTLANVTESPAVIIGYLALGIFGNSAFLSFISSQIWNVIADVFSTNQSKRLFSLLGISGTASGVVAGICLQWLTPLIGTSGILLVSIIFLLLTIPAILGFQKRFRKELSWVSGDVTNAPHKSAIKETFRYVFGSRFILAIAGIIILHWFFDRLFGFMFAEVANQSFPTEESFTQFSGLYLIASCLGSILFDSLFLNRILEKTGLTRGMFLVSNVVAVLAIGIFAFPLLPVIIGASYVRDIILSVQGNNAQVMIGVVPDDRRAQVSTFLDGFISTVGSGLGSLLIIAITWVVPASASLIFEVRVIMGLILLLLAIRYGLNIYLRREFFRILEENLSTGDLKTKLRAIETLVEHKYLKQSGIGKLIDVLKDPSEPLSVKEGVVSVLGNITDPTTLRVLIHQLSSSEPSLRLAAARALSEFHLSTKQFYEVAFSRHHAVEELRLLFKREQDSAIRAAALDALIHLEDPEIVPFLLSLLENGDKKTRIDCVHSLRLFHDPAMMDDLKKLLMDEDIVLRTKAIVALWQFPWEQEKLGVLIKALIKETSEKAYLKLSDDEREAQRIGLKTVGDVQFEELKPLLLAGLTWNNSPILQTECALSLFKMGDSSGRGQLIKVLQGTDMGAIERVRLVAKTRVFDVKASAIIQELIEQNQLQYPSDVPSVETLNRPLGMIPVKCLEKLEKLYKESGEREELIKINAFLAKKLATSRPKGTVLLIESEARLARMFMIGLLANGHDVRWEKTLSKSDSKVHQGVIVYDGGPNIPNLSIYPKEVQDRMVIILGKQDEGEKTDIARVERAEGVVFRQHFSPSELVEEVEKLNV